MFHPADTVGKKRLYGHIELPPQWLRRFRILQTRPFATGATALLIFVVSAFADEAPPPISANVPPKLRGLMERTLSADAGEREAAAHELRQLEEDAIHAIPFLIRLLDDEKNETRDHAFGALKKLGESAVQPLIDHLSHCTSARRRKEIARLFKYLEDRRALEPLIKLLDDKDAEVRRTATWALRSFSDSKATYPLVAKLGDTDTQVRANAALTLGKIGDGNAVESLIEALKDKESRVRSSAAYALSSIPDSRSLQPLLACLQDSDQHVREDAMLALGKLKDARAVEPLISMFQHDSETRGMAAYALGEIGDARAVEPIIVALQKTTNKEDRHFRISAARALWNLKDPRSRDVLTDMVLKGKRASLERIWAANALGNIRDGRVAEPLVTVWKNEKEPLEIRLAAANSLGQTRDHRAIDALAFVLEKGWRPWTRWAVELLGERKDPRAKKILRKALEHRDTAVRMAATIAIKKQELDEKLEKEEEE